MPGSADPRSAPSRLAPIVAVLFTLTSSAVSIHEDVLSPAGPQPRSAAAAELPARRVVRYAESLVQRSALGPTDAARLYAYVTTVYAQVRDSPALDAAPGAATAAARTMAEAIEAQVLGGRLPRSSPTSLPSTARTVLARSLDRADTDGWADPGHPGEPAGPGHWTAPPGQSPTTPGAGHWRLWLAPGPVGTPAPPAVGSADDLAELRGVQAAIARRTQHDEERIRFWRAKPGSVTPAGMWLDLADEALAGRLPADRDEADLLVARLQRTLAQAVADSARECWRIKYVYWTARPSQRIPGLALANSDPPFPAYPSGHSTMSATAATVLGAFLPQDADRLMALAAEARDSRLLAGVHFPVDNDVGFALGVQVGRSALTALRSPPAPIGAFPTRSG